MENNTVNVSKYTAAFGVSYLIASIFNALLIIIKETNTSIKDGMKALLGHHWTTHGVLVIILFLVLGLILTKTKLEEKLDAKKLTHIVVWGTLVGGLIIIGFFFKHLFE